MKRYYLQGDSKIPQHENRNIYISKISQKCIQIFAPNFAHLFRTNLRLSPLICAVFTSHTPKRRKRKLQKRLLQLNKKVVLLKRPEQATTAFLGRYYDISCSHAKQ